MAFVHMCIENNFIFNSSLHDTTIIIYMRSSRTQCPEL